MQRYFAGKNILEYLACNIVAGNCFQQQYFLVYGRLYTAHYFQFPFAQGNSIINLGWLCLLSTFYTPSESNVATREVGVRTTAIKWVVIYQMLDHSCSKHWNLIG